MRPILFFAGGLDPHPAMILPFAVMLLAVAIMPFLNAGWWERHLPKVAVGLAAVPISYYAGILGHSERVLYVAHEYISFMALIGSLFVVAGGIHIDVKGEATPGRNALYLLGGAMLANVIGTTGASMLLIRPWIRMNKYRITGFHIVFFIFIVSNAGGSLTPIGDPPLFLGYLKGVPFWWVLKKCWVAWLIVVGGLVGVFYVLDWRNFLRAPRNVREAETGRETWKVEGLRNLGFLALILVAVFIKHPAGLSEVLMISAALGSWFATSTHVHQANTFSFHPLREVAWLFAGIFATMIPALDYLQAHAGELGLDSEMKFFWLSGSLSGVLDNAPTYLAFLAAAMGRNQLSIDDPRQVLTFATEYSSQLIAISLGSVFFGAMTYIGNGPNFMVKSIAQQAKVRTPEFFTYLWKYAIPILLPLFAVVSLLFFSRWRFF